MRKLKPEEYEAVLKPLLVELSAMARWIAETEQRVLVIFEGRDTAGKGGAITAIQRSVTMNRAVNHAIATALPMTAVARYQFMATSASPVIQVTP